MWLLVNKEPLTNHVFDVTHQDDSSHSLAAWEELSLPMLWVLGGGGCGCGCLFGEGRCLCSTQLPWLHNRFDKTLLWNCCYCLKQLPLHPYMECWVSTPFSLASWRVLLFMVQCFSSCSPAGRCLRLGSLLPTQFLFFKYLLLLLSWAQVTPFTFFSLKICAFLGRALGLGWEGFTEHDETALYGGKRHLGGFWAQR